MHREHLQQCLESVEMARPVLRLWGLRDSERGYRNFASLGRLLGIEELRSLIRPMGRFLPRCSDADMALNNFERFLESPAARDQIPFLLETRAKYLETLLQLLSTSQFFSDLLIANPDYLDMLRVPLRRSPSPAELGEQLRAEVAAAHEDSAVLRAFRRFRQRHILRIGTNDIIRDRPLEEITRDIAHVADAALEVAFETALRQVGNRFGQPVAEDGLPCRCVILAFGKLGG